MGSRSPHFTTILSDPRGQMGWEKDGGMSRTKARNGLWQTVSAYKHAVSGETRHLFAFPEIGILVISDRIQDARPEAERQLREVFKRTGMSTGGKPFTDEQIKLLAEEYNTSKSE